MVPLRPPGAAAREEAENEMLADKLNEDGTPKKRVSKPKPTKTAAEQLAAKRLEEAREIAKREAEREKLREQQQKELLKRQAAQAQARQEAYLAAQRQEKELIQAKPADPRASCRRLFPGRRGTAWRPEKARSRAWLGGQCALREREGGTSVLCTSCLSAFDALSGKRLPPAGPHKTPPPEMLCPRRTSQGEKGEGGGGRTWKNRR